MGRIEKKVLSWMMCLMMAVGMLPGMTRKAEATEAVDVGIIQRNDGIYEISNYAGLLEFAKIVNGTSTSFANDSGACAIISDGVKEIDASASNPASPGYDDQTTAWTPIGNDSSHYTGKFDGNGCTIKGLTIDSADDDIGLFGYVGGGRMCSECCYGRRFN